MRDRGVDSYTPAGVSESIEIIAEKISADIQLLVATAGYDVFEHNFGEIHNSLIKSSEIILNN